MRLAFLGPVQRLILKYTLFGNPSQSRVAYLLAQIKNLRLEMVKESANSVLHAHGCLGILLASWAAGCSNITGSDGLASYRAQNESAWSIHRLFARREDDQELRDVSVEPDAGKKGHQKDAQQDKLSSLRDSGNLRNHR